jgi:hypothetical protein
MSNISSITGTTYPYQSINQPSLFLQSLQSVGSSLQTGDLSSAQSAFSIFQQNLQANSTSAAQQPFGGNSQANSAFQNLSSALQSNDLSSAQKSFADLQTSLSSVHKGHHHHGSKSTEATTSPSTTNPTTSTTSTTSTKSTGGANASSATDDDGDHDGSVLDVTA